MNGGEANEDHLKVSTALPTRLCVRLGFVWSVTPP